MYDFIVVGGGSAGCVLANRLSSSLVNRVLLIEAGQDTPPGSVPQEIRESYPAAYLDKRFYWPGLKVSTQPVSHNDRSQVVPFRKYEQARVMGGGSSINGQLSNRGAPTDFDEWVTRGATGWGWDDVLPYFRKLERDIDFDDSYHGNSGPIPIRRIFPEQWNGHAKALAKALDEAGYKYLPDQNGKFEDGYFPMCMSNLYETRVSSATGYLEPKVRRRQNLEIMPNVTVKHLNFSGRKCTGVTVEDASGHERVFDAGEVILSAGAIYSPTILMRSGVGPALHLKDQGIEVVQNLSGVGQRLMDHPSIALSSFIKKHARRTDEFTGRHILMGIRYSSNLYDAPAGDMFVSCASKSAWHAVGEQIASFLLFVNKTYSESGYVELESADWRVQPMVRFNLLSDRRDLERLKDGFRRMGALQMSAAMQEACSDPFPASYSEKVRQVGDINARNRFLTNVMARLLDGPAPLRSVLMRKVIADKYTFLDAMADDDLLEEFISKAAIGVWHASCSCRMGAADDPLAVTDSVGRVRNMENLRIADASIFPVVPCANTNIPTIMVAEKIADHILTTTNRVARESARTETWSKQ